MAASKRTEHNRPRPQVAASLALLIAVAIWGTTFVVVKDAVTRWPVFPFLMVRFWISAVSFVPLLWWERRKRHVSSNKTSTDGAIRHGFAAGTALFLAYGSQTVGIELTPVSTAAFLTNLFVLFVPLILLVRQRWRPNAFDLGSAAVAVVGVVVFNQSSVPNLQLGTLLLTACAFFYAVQITLVGSYGKQDQPVTFTAIQITTVAVFSTAVAIPIIWIKGCPPFDQRIAGAAIFTGIIASSVAYMIQTWAQRHISSTRSAVLLTLEPVFATGVALLALQERLTLNIVLGGLLILVAVLTCSLRGGSKAHPDDEKTSAGNDNAHPDDDLSEANHDHDQH